MCPFWDEKKSNEMIVQPNLNKLYKTKNRRLIKKSGVQGGWGVNGIGNGGNKRLIVFVYNNVALSLTIRKK